METILRTSGQAGVSFLRLFEACICSIWIVCKTGQALQPRPCLHARPRKIFSSVSKLWNGVSSGFWSCMTRELRAM